MNKTLKEELDFLSTFRQSCRDSLEVEHGKKCAHQELEQRKERRQLRYEQTRERCSGVGASAMRKTHREDCERLEDIHAKQRSSLEVALVKERVALEIENDEMCDEILLLSVAQ